MAETRIGARIREVRKARRLTQEEVAKAASTEDEPLTGGYVSRVETGAEPNPSWNTLERIATGLAVDVSVICLPVGSPTAFAEKSRKGLNLTIAASDNPPVPEHGSRTVRPIVDVDTKALGESIGKAIGEAFRSGTARHHAPTSRVGKSGRGKGSAAHVSGHRRQRS